MTKGELVALMAGIPDDMEIGVESSLSVTTDGEPDRDALEAHQITSGYVMTFSGAKVFLLQIDREESSLERWEKEEG